MKTPSPSLNREAWLEQAIVLLNDQVFKRLSPTLLPEKIRVSVGFPYKNSRAIGQHWHPKASKDNVSQIFISPTHLDSISNLETLAHELVHACVPDAGHGKHFRRIAVAIGLKPPMRSTTAGDTLLASLRSIAEILGPIPHATISLNLNSRKKQSTRLVKVSCPDCGYICRITRSWLELLGPPLCPCSGDAMQPG